MKLITSNKDYYDHFARDRKVSDQAYIWERKPKVVPIDFAIPDLVRAGGRHWNPHRSPSPGIEATGFIVWFCGIAVPIVEVETWAWTSGGGYTKEKTEFFYSFNSLPAQVKGEEPGKCSMYSKKYRNTWQQFEDLFALGGDHGWGRHNFTTTSHVGRIMPKVSIAEMHRRIGSPVFCHPNVIKKHEQEFHETGVEAKATTRGRRIPSKPCALVNPLLAYVEFHKHIDAFQAFLAIEQYLSNDLAPRDIKRDMSIKDNPVPDKIKAESHGFDKWSFRKEPAKHR